MVPTPSPKTSGSADTDDQQPTPAAPDLTFCSTVSEASGEDPAGSAWAIRRYVMVELPLPWPYNSLQSRNAPAGLEDFIVEAYGKMDQPWGFVGIAPDAAYSVDGVTRIIDLRQGEALARAYHRDTYLVPANRAVDYLRMIAFEPDNPELIATKQPDDQSSREFFICTHAAIDICCATVGYPMYQLLRKMAEGADTPTRVWRCTHFGGHRFAATAFEAPQGRYWGRLKAPMLARLMHRHHLASELRQNYRGWAALDDPLWQIAEAEIFAAAGWAWFDATITTIHGTTTPESGGTLTVVFTHPDTGDAEVDVAITPNGAVTTMEASRSSELHEAPQYAARIIAQRPGNALDRIAALREGEKSPDATPSRRPTSAPG